MSAKGLAVSAAEMVGSKIVAKKANKAIDSLPVQKQNKIRGIFMIASAVMLLVSGIRLLKKSKQQVTKAVL
ncbi:hypothetical protein [Niastella populi]|nr:hypothetical protein [Niastella populi]